MMRDGAPALADKPSARTSTFGEAPVSAPASISAPTTAAARLDTALVARGLARSRTRAAALISALLVTVNGEPATKASVRVRPEDTVEVAEDDHWVSRAALKLVHALDEWPAIEVRGRSCLDVGASTGGFTQVLLEAGAAHVVALDVGHDQLAPRLRDDARVTTVEGFNARELTADSLAGAPFELVVGDVSFISLTMLLQPIAGVADEDADIVLLVKPQFEVGRGNLREGIVTDDALRQDAVERVLWAAHDTGLRVAGIARSPIAGTHGNLEVLVWLRRDGRGVDEFAAEIAAAARRG